MDTRHQSGSFIVAGAFFLMGFLMFAGIGVDLSNYLYQKTVLQDVADGAALAGGNALSTYGDKPDKVKAYNAVVNHIQSAQGDSFAKLYEMTQEYDSNINDTIVKDVNGRIYVSGPYGSTASQYSGQGGKGINFTQGGSMKFISGNQGEVTSPSASSIQAIGSGSVDLDGDRRTEVPYVTNSSTLKYIDSEGNKETINLPADKQADLDKTLMAVGSWTGSDPSIYYTGDGHEKIYSVSKGEAPSLVADPDNGVNAVSGFGDINGDGSNELIFADGSQDPRYMEQGAPTSTTFSKLQNSNVGTPGSNNGIGYGAPVDFDGDGVDEVPVVGGGNGVALLTANSDEYLGGGSGCGCARKSPVAITNMDNDDSLEVAFQDISTNEVRYYDDDESLKTLQDSNGNSVFADDQRGLVAGIHGTSKPYYKVGALVYEQFNTYFLPREIFTNTDHDQLIDAMAIARVDGERRSKNALTPVECQMYADGSIQLTGQNINANVDVCGNSSIEAGNIDHLGDVNQYDGQYFNNPSGWTGQRETYSDLQQVPKYESDSPNSYDVQINDDEYEDWNSGSCSTGKAADGLQWGNNSDVCIVQEDPSTPATPADTQYRILDGGGNSSIESSSGDPVSMYSDGDLLYEGSGSNSQRGGIRGGIYVEGDFTSVNNNNNFTGDPDVKGGLAIWAEGDVDIQKNNIRVDGILGTTNGSLTFGTNGGGNGPQLHGTVSTGGNFEMPSNSNAAEILSVPSNFDSDYMTEGGFMETIEEEVETPYFSQVNVYLIG